MKLQRLGLEQPREGKTEICVPLNTNGTLFFGTVYLWAHCGMCETVMVLCFCSCLLFVCQSFHSLHAEKTNNVRYAELNSDVYICLSPPRNAQIFTWPEQGGVCLFLRFLLYSPLQTDRASEWEHCSMSWLQLSAKPSSWALSQETPKNRANCSTNVPRSWTPDEQMYVTEQIQAIQSQAEVANSLQRLRNTAVPGF